MMAIFSVVNTFFWVTLYLLILLPMVALDFYLWLYLSLWLWWSQLPSDSRVMTSFADQIMAMHRFRQLEVTSTVTEMHRLAGTSGKKDFSSWTRTQDDINHIWNHRRRLKIAQKWRQVEQIATGFWWLVWQILDLSVLWATESSFWVKFSLTCTQRNQTGTFPIINSSRENMLLKLLLRFLR